MRTAAMLLALLTIIVFSGCGTQETIIVSCKVPYTQKPTLDNKTCDDYNNTCVVSKILRNYEAIKDYANRLEINQKVCQ